MLDFDAGYTLPPQSGIKQASTTAPTCVLIEPDGETFSAFGYDAETKYTRQVEAEEHEKWYFFRRFKMKLYKKVKVDGSEKSEFHRGKVDVAVQEVAGNGSMKNIFKAGGGDWGGT
ncbi:hypothetical protein MAR_012261 [Mya arenaria]|uniref:Uncharacterized protein n=1 Tax=Mya arenaria TaxID=6604 RepID=A0ABY7FWJ7_MYAAR|nr:hypothetical protein MAR_012261 [Mya arenaria]